MSKRKIIIVGGDKIASDLIGLLSEENSYDIRVIESRIAVCERLANRYAIKVFHGDGTNVDVLERADAMDASVLIALTGEDESNLVACQLAKLNFNAKMTIAKVNNPRNSGILKLLGVDKIFSSTEIIAKMIDQEVSYSGMSVTYNIPGSSKAIVSFPLHPKSPANHKSLAEFDFVGDSRVVLVTRSSGEVLIPTGDLVMMGGDTLLMVCDQDDFEAIWHLFVRPDLEALD